MPDENDQLSPPDDFGAAVIAEFQKRADASDNGDNGDGPGAGAPPGGWPEVDPKDVTPAPKVQPVADPPADTPEDTTTSGAPEPEGEPPADAAPDPAGDEPPAQVAPAEGGAGEEGGVGEAPHGGYRWEWQEGNETRTAEFDDATVQRALSLTAWAENLPPEMRDAFGAIEAGQAVAIARADYDQFVAWKQQQDRSSRDTDLSNLDVDPDVAQLISSLRDEIATLKGGTPQVPGQMPVPGQPAQYGQQQPVQQVDPQYQAAVNAEMQRTTATVEAASAEYAKARGLTDAETQQLMTEAVRAEVIPHLAEKHTPVNPLTGQALSSPDMRAVTYEALDFALVRNQALSNKVAAARSSQPPANPAVTDPANPAASASVPTSANSVEQKKARAASLASAPSGAPSPAPRDVKAMSPQDRVNAMAADIEAALKAS